jgi:subfamily B ATP-binding cassette protein MsbA
MRKLLAHALDLGQRVFALRPHVRAGRYLVVGVVSSTVAAAFFEGAGVSLLVPLLSLLLGGEGATPMRPIRWMQEFVPGLSASGYVAAFCLLVLAAILTKNVVLYGSQMLAARLRRRIAGNLRRTLFARLHEADIGVFEQRPAGELANTFIYETTRAVSFIDHLILLGQRGSMGAFYVALLLVISWQLTAVTLLLAVTVGFVVRFAYRRLRRSGQEIVALNRRLASVVLESFAGVRVVRTTHSQSREMDRFEGVNRDQAAADERIARQHFLIVPLTETVAVAGAMAIVGCAYFFFVRSGHMLSSHLLGFGFILIRLLPLLNQLYGIHGQIVYLAEGVREVEAWLNRMRPVNPPHGELEFRGVRQAIEFDRVTFDYAAERAGVSEVSFAIPAGKTVALVGPSGAGKSTLAFLLLRLRRPTDGAIRVDGQDYWVFTAESWHRAVAWVEQEAFLFHDTLARNVRYGFDEATDAAVQAAVAEACLQDVVEGLPQGLETVVGERGLGLSGGQRQRLAIARALVRQPRILILDEATSALDLLAENRLQATLRKVFGGRTVLIIAHRLWTLQNVDHIVVLDRGRVVQQGTWNELVHQPGLFANLVQAAAAHGLLLTGRAESGGGRSG